MPLTKHANSFEQLYERYNRREFVHPDPLEFLYDYDDPADREIVGLIASCLAYGRVGQILRSVSVVLDRLGPSPAKFLQNTAPGKLGKLFGDFKHRFATGEHLAALLAGIKKTISRHGSLERCFSSSVSKADSDILPALCGFFGELKNSACSDFGHLLADPARKSACKRLNLYLRWMVRCDSVDPGGWTSVSPSNLLIPLDTHMYRIGRAFGLTQRKSANLQTALEITSAFRKITPEDPVRYDFALTRLGIRTDTDLGEFLAKCEIQCL